MSCNCEASIIFASMRNSFAFPSSVFAFLRRYRRRIPRKQMRTLLHIEASPRLGRSHSSQLAAVFIDAVERLHPYTKLDHLNVWTEALPEFSGALLEAKYAKLSGS